jgi:hypothetical protein
VRRERPWPVAAALVAVAVAAFAPALGGDPVGDDFALLRTVDRVEGPLWPFAHNDLGEPAGSGHFYRPLWVAWNALLVELGGGEEAVLHAGNLLLYAIAVLELWLLARALLPPAGALVAALAFALHPRHGESVAWISGSTDLVAAALALGALVAAVRLRGGRRLLVAALLAAAAVAGKEAAVVAPLLAAGVVWLRGRLDGEASARADALRVGAAMLAAQAAVLAARWVVVGGLGGYADEPFSARRGAGAFASYVLGALTPPQLRVLEHPALLLVPLALAALLALAVVRARRRGDGRGLAVAALGGAWFLVAVAPVLNLPLDLNSANGERLLLLPSAGLALAVGALVPARAGRRAALAGGAVAALALVACWTHAATYVAAGEIASRTVRQAVALAPPGGELVVLSLPDSYRQARVFPNSFDVAVARAGARDVRVARCLAVHVRDERAGAVAFAEEGGAWIGTAREGAAFDVPVLGSDAAAAGDCALVGSRGGGAPGEAGEAAVRPPPPSGPRTLAYFDGRDLRPVP